MNPNVFYNLTFKYTYYDENKTLKEYTFDSVGVRTSIPKINLSVVKIVNHRLYYKISLDKNYTVVGGTINLYLNNQFSNITASIPAKGNVSTISGNDCYLDISSLELSNSTDNLLSLRVVNLNFNTYSVNPSVSYNFKY